jgi:hypothetical protein
MRSRIQAGTFVLLFCFVTRGVCLDENAAGAGEAKPAVTRTEIISLRAFLYYHEKGEIDARDILTAGIALRNVIIGEGDALGRSGAVLVLVGVKHRDLTSKVPPTIIIRLTAAAGKRILVKQDVPLRTFFSERETIEVPFLVYGIGCERVEMTASFVEGSRIVHSLSRTAEFRCGE